MKCSRTLVFYGWFAGSNPAIWAELEKKKKKILQFFFQKVVIFCKYFTAFGSILVCIFIL